MGLAALATISWAGPTREAADTGAENDLGGQVTVIPCHNWKPCKSNVATCRGSS